MIFIRFIVINIPLALMGAKLYGVAGLFGAIALTNVITGITFHFWNKAFFDKTTSSLSQSKH